jgi:hypothetical protein
MPVREIAVTTPLPPHLGSVYLSWRACEDRLSAAQERFLSKVSAPDGPAVTPGELAELEAMRRPCSSLLSEFMTEARVQMSELRWEEFLPVSAAELERGREPDVGRHGRRTRTSDRSGPEGAREDPAWNAQVEHRQA